MTAEYVVKLKTKRTNDVSATLMHTQQNSRDPQTGLAKQSYAAVEKNAWSHLVLNMNVMTVGKKLFGLEILSLIASQNKYLDRLWSVIFVWLTCILMMSDQNGTFGYSQI